MKYHGYAAQTMWNIIFLEIKIFMSLKWFACVTTYGMIDEINIFIESNHEAIMKTLMNNQRLIIFSPWTQKSDESR